MTEVQLASALAGAIGATPESAHTVIKESINDFLKDMGMAYAASKFVEAMEWAEPNSIQDF